MSNKTRNSNGLTFIAGLIVGGATLYYLNTPAGKRLRKTIKEKGQDLSQAALENAENMKEKLIETSFQAKEKIADVVENGKQKVGNIKNSISNHISDLIPENQTVKDFKAGVKAAKQNMNAVSNN
jgi:gas vesicle protein